MFSSRVRGRRISRAGVKVFVSAITKHNTPHTHTTRVAGGCVHANYKNASAAFMHEARVASSATSVERRVRRERRRVGRCAREFDRRAGELFFIFFPSWGGVWGEVALAGVVAARRRSPRACDTRRFSDATGCIVGKELFISFP